MLFLTFLSSILHITLEVSPHRIRRVAHVHQGELAIYLPKHEVANQTNPKKRCYENYQYLFLTKVWITTVLIPRISSTSSAANFQNDCQLSHTWKLLLINTHTKIWVLLATQTDFVKLKGINPCLQGLGKKWFSWIKALHGKLLAQSLHAKHSDLSVLL